MRPVRITGADPRPLGAPADWSEEAHGHCGALFVRREEIEGLPYMRSAWEVEDSEAALLYAGARMTLGISGHAHPVVQVGVSELPTDFQPTVMARRFTHANGQPGCRVEMLFPHGGGRRGFIEVVVDGPLSMAVAAGISLIEELARREGWTE
ncbi:MAG: hypothetical protein WKF79_00190 [Nocardioides sp.]